MFKYINIGNPRSVGIKKNILQSFFIKGGNIGISFLLVPMTITYLSPERYGIWITLSSIIGWLSYFDIGIGNGLRNKLGEAIAKKQFNLARIYVSTTYAIFFLLIFLIIALFYALNPLINWEKVLNTPSGMGKELFYLAQIVTILFCLQFIIKLLNTILIADQRPARVDLINLISSLVSLILIFILTKVSQGNLILLGFILGISPVVVLLVASIFFFRTTYRYLAPSLKFVNFRYAGSLFSLGLNFFLIQIIVLIVFSTTNIIITQLYGPAAVTPYNVAFRYFSIIIMGFNIISTPFWSAYTNAYFTNDFNWIRNSVRKLIRIWILFGVGTIILIAVSNPFYKIWVGDQVQVSFGLSLLLGMYAILANWSAIFTNFINGVSKIRLQLYLSVFLGLINIPLSIFLGKALGVGGVVLSTCICMIISAVWAPLQYYKIINNRTNGIWGK